MHACSTWCGMPASPTRCATRTASWRRAWTSRARRTSRQSSGLVGWLIGMEECSAGETPAPPHWVSSGLADLGHDLLDNLTRSVLHRRAEVGSSTPTLPDDAVDGE